MGGNFDSENGVSAEWIDASIFQGTGKVSITGSGELSITCRINPGSDKKVGSAKEVISAIVGCLHGDSSVDTPTGPRKVKELSVGDKALALNPASGALVYDDVVFSPHKDDSSLTLYQDIQASVPAMQESRRLQVTATHYVPVGTVGNAFKLVMPYMQSLPNMHPAVPYVCYR
jgi:hypothetical protein